MTATDWIYTFTVFTPTFNRAATLRRVYDSLRTQTFHDFEWLVIDDGSTDETRELVSGWREEADFPIRYEFQENAGKHAAHNRGIRAARGALFLTLDSDDTCLPTALERLKYHWDTIPDGRRQRFSAVTTLCSDRHGVVVGTRFPHDPTDSDPGETLHLYRVRGEKWGFHRTEILRRFPFPVTDFQGPIPEAIVWNAIGRQYLTRYVNEPLRIYQRDEPGRFDHLSRRMLANETAAGSRLFYREELNRDIRWFPRDPGYFLLRATQYARYCFHLEQGPLSQFADLENVTARCLYLAALPAGFLLFLLDRVGVSESLLALLRGRAVR